MKRLLLYISFIAFTTAIHAQGPGGQEDDLLFWLRADAGTSTTTDATPHWGTWNDQSGNNINPWTATAPVYRRPAVNFNPALDWAGSAAMGIQDAGMNGGGNRKSVVIAFKTGADVTTRQVLFEYGGSNQPPFRNGMNIYIDAGSLYGMLIEKRNEYSASTPIAPNTSYVFILSYDGSSGRWDGYLNGSHVMNNVAAPASLPSDYDNGGIGCIQGGTQFAGSHARVTSGNVYQGYLMEVAFYDDRVLNAGARQDIFSYLGIKYGITMAQDYNFADNGSIYWNQSSNSTYHHDVAGIIRNNATNLHQKQSQSVNADALVTIAHGALAGDNMGNSNNLSDEDYLVWGNDNGDTATFDDEGAPSGRLILGRTWKIEDDGVGTVEIQVPDNSSGAGAKLPVEETNIYLLAHNSPDFSSGATEFTMTLNGTNWELTTDLSAYSYFTFATEPPPAPGGVTDDLVFWLKADTGTNTTVDNGNVSSWLDRSPNENDAFALGTNPRFREVVSNYNPALDFSGAANGMGLSDNNAINTSNSSRKSYAVVFKTGSDISTRQMIYEQGGGTHGMNLYINGGNLYANLWVSNADNSDFTPIEANTTYVLVFVYNGGALRWQAYLNGTLAMNDGSVPSTFPAHGEDIGIGEIIDGTQYPGNNDLASGDAFRGWIMEMAYYNGKAFSNIERKAVSSYLAVKYGISLGHDYVSSSGGSTTWDYSAHAGFNNNITGIALDALTGLDQKQSRPDSEGHFLQIGLGNIAYDNLSNVDSFDADLDFLIWGDNGAPATGETDNTKIPPATGITDKLQRVWKAVENGSVGTVEMAFLKSWIDTCFEFTGYGGYYLRIADNDGLSLNAVDMPLSTATINGEVSYTVDVDFDGTKYFTIIQKGFIIWNGTEWRGGLSVLTDHGPSDDPEDAAKPMFIQYGDTAGISEAVVVDSVHTEINSVLSVKPLACLRTSQFESDGDFIIEADATGFGQYKGPAVEGTYQQFIDNDGWHLIGSPFSDATWGDLSFKNDNGFVNHPLDGVSKDSCNYCNIWWYDASTDNGTDIGFMSTTAYGTWRTSSDASEAFIPTKGWNLYLDGSSNFGSAPWTISFSGTFNQGNISQTVNENNSGWNLMANPYPSVIDWDEVDKDLAAANIAAGYHIWDHANTNFAVYANGSGTLGASQYIAPLQGFYVQTANEGAQNSANVYHSFDLTDDDRPDDCQNGGGNFYKSSLSADNIKLRTRHLGSGKIDEVIVQFAETSNLGFDSREDIRKLLTSYDDVGSIYAMADNELTVISSVPVPSQHDSINVGVKCKDKSQLSIEAVEVPAGVEIFLEDLMSGQWHRLDEAYNFVQDKSFPNRFVLHYGYGPITPRNWVHENPFTVYMDHEQMIFKSLKRLENAEWYLTNIAGGVVASGRVDADSGNYQRMDVSELAPGVYIFVLLDEEEKYTEKLPKLR